MCFFIIFVYVAYPRISASVSTYIYQYLRDAQRKPDLVKPNAVLLRRGGGISETCERGEKTKQATLDGCANQTREEVTGIWTNLWAYTVGDVLLICPNNFWQPNAH